MKYIPYFLVLWLLGAFLAVTYYRYDWHLIARCNEKFCIYGITIYIGD